MSQANVDRVLAAYELFNRTHEADTDLLHRAVLWRTAEDLPDSATHHGHDGVAKLFSEWFEAFDGFRADVEEAFDAGESVVVVVRLRGRLKASNEEVLLPETHVWQIVDGKAVEVHEYRTKTEALKAVGLAE